ncbi:MAG: hypothetical protein QOI57_3094 [Rubrobacteraceae bacterium]|nr:hypothetical protein [Rubrobacteraceae bacterium]
MLCVKSEIGPAFIREEGALIDKPAKAKSPPPALYHARNSYKFPANKPKNYILST